MTITHLFLYKYIWLLNPNNDDDVNNDNYSNNNTNNNIITDGNSAHDRETPYQIHSYHQFIAMTP